MASSESDARSSGNPVPARVPLKRLPLGRGRQRLSFERRLRLWLYLMGSPALLLIVLQLRVWKTDASIQWIIIPTLILLWIFLTSLLIEQVIRPLQTLANVIAALRENDYSFRARGGRRNDALGDLALEINALAGTLQAQRVGAMEAMALVERVMKSMQSPVLAFDPEGRLKLLNAAAERAFQLRPAESSDRRRAETQAGRQDLDRLLLAQDNELLSLAHGQQSARWVVKRTSFRLRGVPHALFVLADVSEALREEERQAWERLIRVLGHEINNSLTPIKSIANSLRRHSILNANLNTNLAEIDPEDREDFTRGLEVIEDRAESLNRFLQAYRELMGLPAPRLEEVSLAAVIRRVAALETRLAAEVASSTEVVIRADADQLSQALINLVRNATEAALSADARGRSATGPGPRLGPRVVLDLTVEGSDAVIRILDNGPGLSNPDNLFVPFYTTKPGGTGIGLVLAQQIALAHGGSIQLTNRRETQGCCATLRLPIGAVREALDS